MEIKIWSGISDPQEPASLYCQIPDGDWIIFHRDELAILIQCRKERKTFAEALFSALPEIGNFKVLQWKAEDVPPLTIENCYKIPRVPTKYVQPKTVWLWTDGALDEDDKFALGWWDSEKEEFVDYLTAPKKIVNL